MGIDKIVEKKRPGKDNTDNYQEISNCLCVLNKSDVTTLTSFFPTHICAWKYAYLVIWFKIFQWRDISYNSIYLIYSIIFSN